MSFEGAATHIVPHGLLRQHSTRRAPANRSPNVFNGFNEDSCKIIILNMKFPELKN